MAELIKIRKGLDIPMHGKPSDKVTTDNQSTFFAICPDDFPGPVWKVVVKEGDHVKAGSPIFADKASGNVKLVTPVTGVIKEINRGERRHVNFVSIEKDNNSAEDEKAIAAEISSDTLTALQESGLWAMMRQRPYDIVPATGIVPRDIFVTSFDTAPLAGNVLDDDLKPWLESGLKILAGLTSGKVYLGVKYGSDIKSEAAYVVEFEGPHPAGNVGTQIASIKPVNKGETIWTMDAATAARIGQLFKNKSLDFHTTVAVTGPKVNDPHYVRTIIGASVKSVLKGFIDSAEGLRIISGNVLTGKKVSIDGFLHYPYRQITVIEEGDKADEFMGWASVNPDKFSVKRSFPAFLKGLSRPFDFDARVKGGKRAMILSGEYDKVFPFDIYPEYLLKAIMANDIDRMEKLGIYEVAPEDFALPEFVDTSKIELQQIVRDGLDYLRKELS